MVVPPLAPLPAKAVLREALKLERHAFVTGLAPAARAAGADALADQVMRQIEPTGVIAAFLPIGEEIDTMPLITRLAAAGASVALPHVTKPSEPLRFLGWHPDQPIAAGPYGLSQPPSESEELSPNVILTPLLGFDAALHRIGYGAGCYDRAFAAHPDARRIGLAWAMQQVEHIPADPWDVPLHAVATERAWIAS